MRQAAPPSDVKPMQVRPYVPSMQMRQLAEKLKDMPRPVHMTSNVSNFRHMEG